MSIFTEKGIMEIKEDINKTDTMLKGIFLKGNTELASKFRDEFARAYTNVLASSTAEEANHHLAILSITKKSLAIELEHMIAKEKVAMEIANGQVADEATWRSRENTRLFMEQVNRF